MPVGFSLGHVLSGAMPVGFSLGHGLPVFPAALRVRYFRAKRRAMRSWGPGPRFPSVPGPRIPSRPLPGQDSHLDLTSARSGRAAVRRQGHRPAVPRRAGQSRVVVVADQSVRFRRAGTRRGSPRVGWSAACAAFVRARSGPATQRGCASRGFRELPRRALHGECVLTQAAGVICVHWAIQDLNL